MLKSIQPPGHTKKSDVPTSFSCRKYFVDCSIQKIYLEVNNYGDFPHSSVGKESACNAGDLGLIPGSGKSLLEKEMAIHSSILAWKIP